MASALETEKKRKIDQVPEGKMLARTSIWQSPCRKRAKGAALKQNKKKPTAGIQVGKGGSVEQNMYQPQEFSVSL